MKLNLGLELKKRLTSSAPRLSLPWLAKTGLTPLSVGDMNAGARGSGPAPSAPQQATGMRDTGGPFAPRPILGVPEMDRDRLDPRHRSETAFDQIRTLVLQARKP